MAFFRAALLGVLIYAADGWAAAGFDIGCAGGCLTAAAVLWVQLPIALAILPGLLGAAAMAVLLRHVYGETSRVVSSAA